MIFSGRGWSRYWTGVIRCTGIPIRLMVGLHYLKHTFNESDETVVDRWVENPYWVRRETGKV